MDDKNLENLIKMAVIDPQRKERYLAVLPKMSGDEKLDFALELWQMWLDKLRVKVKDRTDEMIEEMARSNGEIVYTKEDFDNVEKEVINEMIEKEAGVKEVNSLLSLRSELEQIRATVAGHAQAINDLKSRLDSNT